MEDQLITIFVEGEDGKEAALEAPVDMGFSLMELLKANEYDILATCGGMALCATCCVDVLEGAEKLPEMGDEEYAMLDNLPDVLPNYRLSCQLHLNPDMDRLKIRLHPTD
jgi:2Fe-2S ferredoxin